MKQIAWLVIFLIELNKTCFADYNSEQVAFIKFTLAMVGSSAIGLNFKSTHDDKLGKLKKGYSSNLTLQLHKDWEYAIAATCFYRDCPRLNLSIYDGNGVLIASKTDEPTKPILEGVVPRRTENFSLKITMEDCKTPVYNYGVAIFGRSND